MADVTYPEIVNQMSKLVASWQTYIDQQIQLDNGVANYSSGPVGGVAQPGLGYYPITMPNGLVTWRPCVDRIKTDANAFNGISRVGVSLPLLVSDSGKFVKVSNTGGTTTVNLRVPVGLPMWFNALYYWEGTQNVMQFVADSGVTIIQDQALLKARARGSIVTAISPATNVMILQGSMIA